MHPFGGRLEHYPKPRVLASVRVGFACLPSSRDARPRLAESGLRDLSRMQHKRREGVAGSRPRATATGAEIRSVRPFTVWWRRRRMRCDGAGDNEPMHRGLIPPDINSLPALPERFAWQLPHIKQHRRPMPEGRQIVVDDEGPAVAAMQPVSGGATVVIGVHRWLDSERFRRQFGSRDAALRDGVGMEIQRTHH
jgi:hypothetical protein